MGLLLWLAENWFDFIQSVGIIAGLLLAAATFNQDTRERKTANLIEVTKQHRDIWTELYRRPELRRVLHLELDLRESPPTWDEELFVGLLILHLNGAFHAMRNGVFVRPEGLQKDVQRFFSRPLARAVWDKVKAFQDLEFVSFVELSLSQATNAAGRD